MTVTFKSKKNKMKEKLVELLKKVDPAYFYAILQVVNFIYWLLDQYVIEPIFNHSLIYGSIKERKRASKDDLVAHVVDVRFMAIMGMGLHYDLSNFLITHDKYESLDYILNKANVTLFGLGKDNAIFVVTDESVDIYETKKFPFTSLGQVLEAKKLVIIDHVTLHRLADRLGDPKVQVSILNMTCRCGSTLITQMMSRVPKVRASAETYPSIHAHALYQEGKISRSEYRALLRSSIRVQCKVEPTSDIEHIFMKLNCFNSAQFGILRVLFPKAVLFFNTRQLAPSSRSLKKVMSNSFVNMICTRWGFQWRHLIPQMPVPYDSPKIEEVYTQYEAQFFPKVTWVEHCALMSALVAACYEREPKVYNDIIFYEDLMENPEATMDRIFGIMGMNKEHIDKALSALNRDSQNRILCPRGEQEGVQLTEKDKDDINRMFKRFNVPLTCEMSLEEFKEFFNSRRNEQK